jgi:predicted LPLAT superfamily acyltransferase
MSNDWKQRPEGGGLLALWLIRAIARYGGRALARPLLVPITLYFLAVRGPERLASRTYLSRVLGRRARLADTARHIHTFASTILDRVFLLSGQLSRFRFRLTGLGPIHAQIDQGRGVLLFGSHLGSFDVLRVLARERPDVQVRVVLDKGHSPAMTRMLDALNPEIARGVIDAGQDGPSIVLAIKQATDAGAVVALLVDRARPGDASVPAPFLGKTAMFPAAPWVIATMLGVPVSLAFGLYRGGRDYELAFEAFSDGLVADRRSRQALIHELVQRYAERLEHHARRAPYNWFNFFDFWHADDVQTPPPVSAVTGTDMAATADRDRAAAHGR